MVNSKLTSLQQGEPAQGAEVGRLHTSENSILFFVSCSSETGQTLVSLMVQNMVSLLPWPAAELDTWHKQKKHPVHLK